MTLTQISTNGIKDANVNTADIANDAVTNAKIADDAVDTAQINNNAVTNSKLTPSAVTTAKIADEAVTLAKLPHGTSSNDGKFLRANNGADPTFETVSTDLVGDTTPQLGGDLDANTNNILFGDSASSADDRIKFGASTDLQIFHDGNSRIDHDGGGVLVIRTLGANEDIQLLSARDILLRPQGGENGININGNGSVELYHNDDKKLETSSIGVNIFGDSTVGVNNNTQANLHFTSPSDNASARYSRIRKNYNSPFNMEYFASTSSSAQNHVFYSNLSTEVVRIQGGGGISFNGDTAAANALDDYEEGTFTVGFKFSNQTFNGSLSTAQGYYTKIGRQVFVSLQLVVSNKGTNTSGGAMITGLPFTVLNADNARSSGVVGYHQGTSGIDFPIQILVEQNQTQFPLRQAQATSANIDQSNLSNGFRIYITVAYFTA